ncbi:MAG: hypothetical protein ACD_58C00113G0001, partial [uncultured bacterium]
MKNKNLILTKITFAIIFILSGLMIFSSSVKAQTLSVTGTITDPNSNTISNVYTYIHKVDWSNSQSVYTDSNGVFNFYDLPAGNYILDIYAYHATYADPNPVSVSVTADQTTNLGNIQLLTKNVTGVLTLPDGVTGVPNIYISAHNASWSINKYTYSDSVGNFGFALSQADTYTVEVWSSYENYDPPTPYTFNYLGNGNLSLGAIRYNNRNVTGYFMLPDEVTPVSGGWVNIHNTNWTYSRGSSVDSATGAFGFYVPSTGSYTVEFYGYNSSYPDPDPVTINITNVNNTYNMGTITLVEPNVIGKITEPDGTTPVSYASVNLHNNNWTVYKYASTDSEGNFSLYLGISGTYTMDFWTYHETYSNPDSITFSFTAGSNVYYDGTHGSEVIKLQNPGLRGRVVKPDGSGASYASVSVHDANYTYEKSDWTSTDYDGYFKIKSLATGTYTMEVTPPWDSSQSLLAPDPFSVSLTRGQTNTDYLNNPIYLSEAMKTITGTIKYPDGTKVTDANVYASKQSGGYGWASDEVNSNGIFTLKVGKGKWEVSIWPSWTSGQPNWGYYDAPKTAKFEEDNDIVESKTLNFNVTEFSATVTGKILNPDGTVPSTYDWVNVSLWSQEGGNWSQIDSQGRFNINLPPGTFSIDIYTSNENYASPDLAPITLAENETKNLGTIKLVEKNEFIKGKVTD